MISYHCSTWWYTCWNKAEFLVLADVKMRPASQRPLSSFTKLKNQSRPRNFATKTLQTSPNSNAKCSVTTLKTRQITRDFVTYWKALEIRTPMSIAVQATALTPTPQQMNEKWNSLQIASPLLLLYKRWLIKSFFGCSINKLTKINYTII